MKRVIVVFVILLVAYLLLWPVPIDPVVWHPGADPGFSGQFERNDRLQAAELPFGPLGLGPEDVIQGPDGHLYTGLQDGRILRFGNGFSEVFADTEGRPLGMAFDQDGNLVVADATQGVLAVDRQGGVQVLVDEHDGEGFLLVDDLDIAADGTIYFSDASRRFPVEHYILDAWEGRPTGRLLSFDPRSGETQVLVDELMFANGVALGPDDEFVLVTETFAARVIRHWLKGPDRGKTDVFIEDLPGYPDNLSYNDDGLFWIALPSNRQSALENLAGSRFLRKLLMRLPSAMREIELPPLGWVIAVDTTGEVRENLQDHSGGVYTVTSVNEFDNILYLGSIAMDTVGRFSLSDR